MVMESYMTVKDENKLYGNSTHPGAHFPLSMQLAHLSYLFRNQTAKTYVDVLTDFIQELPSNAWTSWTVSIKTVSNNGFQ